METFKMNGYLWHVKWVDSNNPMLVDRQNILTVATTDVDNLTVYLSRKLQGDFLMRVLLHELGHCALYSFHLLDDIHEMVRPEYWIRAEETICNIIADHGLQIFKIAFGVLGYDAWKIVPEGLEKILSS